MADLIDQAAHCPICDFLPIATQTEVLGELRIELSCPKGHPYRFLGDTLFSAIQNWNRYIMLRIEEDTRAMLKTASRHLNSAYCRSCRRFTKSTTRFEKVTTAQGGYSFVIHSCAECQLVKTQKETT